MATIKKTVTVELLRHGSAHNQLLSPLTQYLGLCGNFGASTVTVPYEHQHFLSRLKILRYFDAQGGDDEIRRAMLEKTSQEMTDILAAQPGLISELGQSDGDCEAVVHLNLVLSAAELAMLPFELANVPPGCAGGEGSHLLLQNRLRVSLTRQVRNIASGSQDWPSVPRILFIIAAPGHMSVPFAAHMRALLDAIAAWDAASESTDREKILEARKELVTVVTDASRKKIQKEIARRQFTHVHILAHGIADTGKADAPYGIALQKDEDASQIDIVNGRELAGLLCPLLDEKRQMPSVVTVSSCDSGNTRSVIYSNGSSLAHDLHHAGVPFVVASQFPLSKKGSKYMPAVLYDSLLWGEDPRISVARLRDDLKLHCPESHDWASVVCYASLPDDIGQQLRKLRYAQSKRAMDAALNQIDDLIEYLTDTGDMDSKSRKDFDSKLKRLFTRVREADARMPTEEGYETEGLGMKASNLKRESQARFQLALLDSRKRDKYIKESLELLRKSRGFYQKAYESNFRESYGDAQIRRSAHWVLCQYLSESVVLGEPLQEDHWGAARMSCEIDLKSAETQTMAWPHGTLAELYLILLGYSGKHGFSRYDECADRVLHHVEALIQHADPGDFSVESTARQFHRYTEWWGRDEFRKMIAEQEYQRSWQGSSGIKAVADKAARKLEDYRKG